MDTAYNRRIASAVDAINHRAARHAPANFVGKGYGSDSGLSTQYNDVMGAAHNHPRAMSQAEREYRAEGERKEFGGGFFDDIGQAFRYTPVGMISDAAQGKQTVFGGAGSDGNGMYGGLGGKSYAMVGTTMPFREVPMAGVMDYGSGMPKYPANKVVQVGNMDGSGEPPKVGCSWYASLEDYKGGRNRMMESKKIGRMTKNPDMPTDLTEDEAKFMEDMFANSPEGAGYYGGEWYNNWNDFTEAIADAYDTVKGVWEDYIKPVLDVVGTPLKDALLSSGNPYGEAGAGVLELLGYGMGGAGSDGNGRGGAGSDGNGRGGNMALGAGPGYGGAPGMSGGRPGVSGGLGGGEGVFANAKPIPANSLGFSPKLEVEQLNAATGSTSYGDMPTSNPVGSGIGGKKRRIVKNVRGVASAPTKMGEGKFSDFFKSGKTKQEEADKETAKMYLGNFNFLFAEGMKGLTPGTPEWDRAFKRYEEMAEKDGYIYDKRANKWEIFYTRVRVKPKGSGMSGEGYEDADGNYVLTPRDMERHPYERYTSLEKNAEMDTKTARLKQAAKDILESARRNAPQLAEYSRDKLLSYVADKLPSEYKAQATMLGYVLSQPYINEWKKSIKDEVKDEPLRLGQGKGGKMKCDENGICVGMDDKYDRNVAQGDKMEPGYKPGKTRHLESDMEDAAEYRKKEERDKFEKEYGKDYGYGRGGSRAMERDGLEISGDNSMGAIVAERGFKPKAQKKAAAVVEKAADNMWNGTQMENTTGRSAKANPSLVLEGGSHPLTQVNNLQAVYGGNAVRSGLTRRGTSNAYGVMIKKVMAEKGLKLGQASKYIKENGLYKK